MIWALADRSLPWGVKTTVRVADDSLEVAMHATIARWWTVRRYIADGQLETVRLGRKTLRIKLDSIERFIDARPGGNWR